jgi:hypothetical protein
MRMIVELNGEAVDGIVKSILIQDYKNLCSDIFNLESAKELPKYKQEDLEHNYRYRSAMETLLEYYVGFNWKSELN